LPPVERTPSSAADSEPGNESDRETTAAASTEELGELESELARLESELAELEAEGSDG
jgi:hypothetical protein